MKIEKESFYIFFVMTLMMAAVMAYYFETITDEEQIHFNYFDKVSVHLQKLGAAYLAQIAGTPADTGAPSKGFVTGPGGGA